MKKNKIPLQNPIFRGGIIFFCLLFISGYFPSPACSTPDTLVHVIEIKGVIEKGLASIVERMIEQAEEAGAQAIIFEVNTPGGAVDAAGEIRDTIFNSKILTVAYVNREAISAGALISLSCEKVVMVPGSTIGAVTPVDLSGKKGSEKVVSYMRGVMRAIAEKRERDPKIAEAMVDEAIEIPDIIEEGKLLTLTAEEALKIKYADHITEGLDNVLEFIGLPNAQIVRPKANWSENMVRFITHPMISSLLLSLGFLGLIYEVTTQGWGVGGTVALFALALFFGSHYLINLANIVEILIFVAGVILILVEIFITPGFGFLGILGGIAVIASIIFSLIGNAPTVEMPDIYRALQTVGLSMIFTVVFAIPIIKLVPKTKTWNRLILNSTQNREDGFRSTPKEYETLVGKAGISLTLLRPAGMALIASKRMDVVTNGEYIEKDVPIQVIEVEGNRIVVQRA